MPVDRGTFVPVIGSPLRGAAAAWPSDVADALKPTYSVVRNPAVPGRLNFVPRAQWSTIGAVE